MPSLQHGTQRPVQLALLRGVQAGATAQRMQTRAPERLIGVDVADAGDKALVHQQRLQSALAPSDALAKVGQRERFVKRLRAEGGEELSGLPCPEHRSRLVPPVQAHAAELARVAHAQLVAVVKREPEMDVLVGSALPARPRGGSRSS